MLVNRSATALPTTQDKPELVNVLAHGAFGSSEGRDDVANRIALLDHRAQLAIFLSGPAILTITRARSPRLPCARTFRAAPASRSSASGRSCFLFRSCHLSILQTKQTQTRASQGHDPSGARDKYLFRKPYVNAQTCIRARSREQHSPKIPSRRSRDGECCTHYKQKRGGTSRDSTLCCLHPIAHCTNRGTSPRSDFTLRLFELDLLLLESTRFIGNSVTRSERAPLRPAFSECP